MASDPGPWIWHFSPKTRQAKNTQGSGTGKCQIFAPAVSSLNEIKWKKIAFRCGANQKCIKENGKHFN